MMFSSLGIVLMSGLMGCDRDAKDLVPVPSDAHPGVIEIGELAIVTKEEFNLLNGLAEDNPIPQIERENCTEREDGTLRCFYGQLGQTPVGQVAPPT